MMDKRVAKHYNGDLSKANILPEKRDALMKQFSTAENETVAQLALK
jgi:hypothetical protein